MPTASTAIPASAQPMSFSSTAFDSDFEPFDELLPGNIGRTAADVSGHPNQLDSAQFRRGWRLPGRGEGQHVVVDDLRPGGWRFGAIAPRFYRQARTATSLPRLAPW